MDRTTAERQAFLRYLLRGARGISSDDARTLHEKRGVTGSASGLAPDSWAEIVGDGFDTSWVIGRCSRIEIANNQLNVSGYVETAETTNRMTYKEEGARADLAGAVFSLPRFTVSGTAPAGYAFNYESAPINLHEIGVNVVVAKELIEEAIGSISAERFLAELLTKKLVSEVERQVMIGRPVTSIVANRRELQGLYYYAINSAQIVTDTGTSQANHIQFSTMALAMEQLRASSYGDACWVLGNGSMSSFMHQTENSGAAGAPNPSDKQAVAQILGKPVFFTPHWSYSESGDIVAMLVDLKNYVLAIHKDGFQVERLNEVAAANGQVVLRASVRAGGNLIDPRSYIQVLSN